MDMDSVCNHILATFAQMLKLNPPFFFLVFFRLKTFFKGCLTQGLKNLVSCKFLQIPNVA